MNVLLHCHILRIKRAPTQTSGTLSEDGSYYGDVNTPLLFWESWSCAKRSPQQAL